MILRISIKLWSSTTTWRVSGLCTWCGRCTRPTLILLKICRIPSTVLCVNITHISYSHCVANCSTGVLAITYSAMADHLMERMVPRWKFRMKVRSDVKHLSVNVYIINTSYNVWNFNIICIFLCKFFVSCINVFATFLSYFVSKQNLSICPHIHAVCY